MIKKLLIALASVSMAVISPVFAAEQGKPKIVPFCKQCHAPAENILRGYMGNISMKAETIQIQIGAAAWLVKFDADTKLTGAEAMNRIPREKEISIAFNEKNGILYATAVGVKPPAKIAPEKLMKVEELAKLVAMGPEKGNYFLVDSRPAPRYAEGHIPGAVNIYDAEFDKNIGRLPKEKDKLLVFYCGGVTCRLSPSSGAKAEKAGYTHVKIFQDGMPEWKKSGNLVYSSVKYLKESMENDMPVVVVDFRPADEAGKGSIKGAVTMKSSKLVKEKFPADKKAPIIIFGADPTGDVFKTIRDWGYVNLSVLEGGLEAWTKAGNATIKGELKTEIVYAAKPRPGEMTVEEFRKVVEALPSDKLLLDVRDADEAAEGILKGAKCIPTREIPGRLSEIPKDKEIVCYCNTGVRAEMGYNQLKEAGYKVRYLNAVLKIGKDGEYEITKE